MKKRFTAILSVFFSVLIGVLAVAGCTPQEDSGSTEPKEYTIQYFDDSGVHSLTVTDGALYSLESVPARTGYDFLGLYDSPEGGIQYVNEKGLSVSAFAADKNMVLYPHWEVKKYSLILDYQGAPITAERQIEVTYGSNLPLLPTNLTIAHSNFEGWFTEKNCGGKQVADKYGLIPVVSVLNEANFDLSNEYIYLYAGFSAATYTVTLNFGSGIASETVEVAYNTDIGEIPYRTRNSDNQAVLSWSRFANDKNNLFVGKITDDETLYAVEWAPVIDFDIGDGSEVSALVARAGSAITLPTPTKSLANFSHWVDTDGNKVELTSMPETSITLRAVWRAMLVFDENGGTAVNDITELADTKITLPVTEKDGYLFAGWYTADKQQYTSTTMPSEGVSLKAGWHKQETLNKVIFSSEVGGSGSSFSGIDLRNGPSMAHFCYTLDLSDLFEAGIDTVNVVSHYSSCVENPTYIYTHMYWYSQPTVSDAYNVWHYSEMPSTSSYQNYKRETILDLNVSKFYICLAASRPSGGMTGAWWKEFWVEIIYPDTATLYL